MAVRQATGLDANDEVLREVQRHMARRGVSADVLAVALGISVKETLCKINGCCSQWMVNDVWRASRLFGVDPVSFLP